MKEKLSAKRILVLIVLALILVAIRFFETKMFYDPFLVFFKSEFQNKPLPEYQSVKLFASLVLRYVINSGVTLVFIYVLFQDRAILKTATFLLVLFLVVLLGLFFMCLTVFNDYMLLFYVRRFLIQPLFLIIFVPAFYYQKLTKLK